VAASLAINHQAVDNRAIVFQQEIIEGDIIQWKLNAHLK